MAAGRIALVVDGTPVSCDASDGESLLSLLRERLGVSSVKDGCAPQGQCGCCTVLVDGEPRVACVTPAVRVAGRSITTVDGLGADERDELAAAFVAAGGSQCGFCTPGIVVRAAWLRRRGKQSTTDVGRALAAHLCRCTGWQTVVEAMTAPVIAPPRAPQRDVDAASRRAALEGGVAQRVGHDVPFGCAGFADDGVPASALVAVPAADGTWAVGESLLEARARAGKVQGRRTTADVRPPLPPRPAPPGGVALATAWVEPAYLEPDASWCEPGAEPATPLANGGAFGGKETSAAPAAARQLAEEYGRPVRVVYSREDVVRLGPKRPPMSATARFVDNRVEIVADVVGDAAVLHVDTPLPYNVDVDIDARSVSVRGPAVSASLRAAGWAERTILVEGALHEARVDRMALLRDEYAPVALDACAVAPSGAAAGARITVDADRGTITGVDIAVMAGDPLDDVVVRSYAIGAAHMALGWVLSEGLAVDPETGIVHDLTIRSFGIIRARDVPPIRVAIVDDARPPLARASDAVFAAVAAATWNAVADADGERPVVFPVRTSRAARALR